VISYRTRRAGSGKYFDDVMERGAMKPDAYIFWIFFALFGAGIFAGYLADKKRRKP
jgi:hypothetical protein